MQGAVLPWENPRPRPSRRYRPPSGRRDQGVLTRCWRRPTLTVAQRGAQKSLITKCGGAQAPIATTRARSRWDMSPLAGDRLTRRDHDRATGNRVPTIGWVGTGRLIRRNRADRRVRIRCGLPQPDRTLLPSWMCHWFHTSSYSPAMRMRSRPALTVSALLLIAACSGGSEPQRDTGTLAVWWADPAHPPTAAARTFTALVSRAACDDGKTGPVHDPSVRELADRVIVTFTLDPLPRGVHTCQGVPPVPHLVRLTQPVGDRVLLDGNGPCVDNFVQLPRKCVTNTQR